MQDTMRTEIKKRIAPERIPGVYRDTGAGIYLRLMTREDTDRIVAWRNSDAVRKNFIYQELFTRASHEHWIRTHVETGDVVQMIICDLEGDKPLGSVYIRDIDRHHNKAEYGIFIDVPTDSRGSQNLLFSYSYPVPYFPFRPTEVSSVFSGVYRRHPDNITIDTIDTYVLPQQSFPDESRFFIA